jgi:Tol biopolymer transport system component
MGTPAAHFFISYSREDATYQKRVIQELRQRGLNVWVDTENLIPGSPAWEREIERAIRGAAGIIVLLSPDANNSEWVRREISFGDDNEKRIFPVLIHGDEDDSVPLRLSSHQRVDLRRNFDDGIAQLEKALRDHLGVTAVHRIPKQTQTSSTQSADLKKFILPAILIAVGLFCITGLGLGISYIFNNISTPSPSVETPSITITDTPPDIDPVVTNTPVDIVLNPETPTGKIVYTCQIAGDEICIINADGSGWQRLTDMPAGSSYANLSPDGQFVVFVGKPDKTTEIMEIDLRTGKIKQLTELEATLGAPEISPDNQYITFTYRTANSASSIWIMDRDGHNPHEFYGASGRDVHDATWSPDGSQILFALGRGESNKLYIMSSDGRDPRLVNDTIDTRGRSDWSVNDLITFDMGGSFLHEIYTMNLDGSNLQQISHGDNAQGQSFSPDGKWIAYTAYTDVANKNTASCEIYIMRVDGADARRLTKNNYCDYQPRWGN